MEQATQRLFVVPGEGLPTLYWDGEAGTFARLDAETPIPDGPVPLPNGRRLAEHQRRLHVIHGRSDLAISGILSLLYDDAAFNEVLNLLIGNSISTSVVIPLADRKLPK